MTKHAPVFKNIAISEMYIIFVCVFSVPEIYMYLTIILRGRAGCEVIDNKHQVGHNPFLSKKPEWNNRFIKNSTINNSSMLILFQS